MSDRFGPPVRVRSIWWGDLSRRLHVAKSRLDAIPAEETAAEIDAYAEAFEAGLYLANGEGYIPWALSQDAAEILYEEWI